MDIINRLHSTFKDCEYFEFGEDYVKFFDKEVGKYFVISISEPKTHEKTILNVVQSIKTKKATKDTRKTWDGIIKAKNNGK